MAIKCQAVGVLKGPDRSMFDITDPFTESESPALSALPFGVAFCAWAGAKTSNNSRKGTPGLDGKCMDIYITQVELQGNMCSGISHECQIL